MTSSRINLFSHVCPTVIRSHGGTIGMAWNGWDVSISDNNSNGHKHNDWRRIKRVSKTGRLTHCGYSNHLESNDG
jgi:hypothetical protein